MPESNDLTGTTGATAGPTGAAAGPTGPAGVTGELAGRVRAALESADLSAIADLLDPEVRWGAPNDPSPACQNRDQVLNWYRRGAEAGTRARVTEIVVKGDRIVVGLAVVDTNSAAEHGGEMERWQVLTVRAGLVVDIVGYDDRPEALARARVPRE